MKIIPRQIQFALLGLVAGTLAAQDARLSNVSVRTSAGGADVLITGFTIGPGPSKQVLVRAVGPTLGVFGVPGVMADPKLELFDGAGKKITENDNFNPADAPVFASVGAFALNAGAKDAALVATLAPGSYTAQVTGLGTAPTGVVLVEVYEVSGGASRLVNLSTRASVGTGTNILIPGITVSAGAGTRRLLVRAVGPTLAAFGVPGTLGDPKLELYSGSTKIAENDNWGTPVGATAADAATLTTTFAQNGAFALAAGSKDAALLTNLASGSYTLQVSGVGNTTGVALVEVYDLTPSVPAPSIAAQPDSLTLTVGASGTLSVTASGASTYQWQKNGVNISGATSATLTLNSAQSADAGNYTVVLTSAGGTVTSNAATLTIKPNQTGAKASGSLYVAQFRPDATVSGSTASGYATILVNSDGSATVNVTFSNLTSAQTAAHLVLGSGRDYVLNLPLGQVAGVTWFFQPSGAFTTNDLINGLNSGNIFVSLDSAKFPGGELRGNFVVATGSQTFTAPAAPPALPASALTAPTPTDAARFLTQATFGPTTATIAALQARGINGWIDDQIALPATGATASLRTDLAAFPNPFDPYPGVAQRFAYTQNWNGVWWKIAATAPDQLRQRTAMALSEIFVVGKAGGTEFNFEALTGYYDILVNRSFGNFRTLLEEVTLHPAMGVWLSHVHNLKADPTKGTAPDENYAREVQQLFTIGLVQLQPDGTLMLDASGQPIPTYNQATISETAKVFTGWSWATEPADSTDENSFVTHNPDQSSYPAHLPDTNEWLVPMRYYDAFHDKTAKNIVSLQQVPLAQARPTVIPAGQTGPQDLRIMLDTIFNHPNTGPFISKQLIQRLVTSNPSPAYVYRVARVFANDGTGTRGNLGAVVRAILTDYEARSPDVLANTGYGKIKEPIIRVVQFLRAVNVTAPNGRYLDSYFGDTRFNPQYAFYPSSTMANPLDNFAQGILQSATVFNFFSPDYSPPGSLAAAGLVAPELQIIDSSFAIHIPNRLFDLMYRDTSGYPQPATGGSPYLRPNYAEFLPNAKNPPALADQLNLLLCANQMTTNTRTQITTMLQAFPATATDTERVQAAIMITLIAPDGALQK